ncbi:hypothetical protein KM043_018018 [Ampulex compressa]|nr:hypothetical protein KM043_018018 [Ampulex compressa]
MDTPECKGKKKSGGSGGTERGPGAGPAEADRTKSADLPSARDDDFDTPTSHGRWLLCSSPPPISLFGNVNDAIVETDRLLLLRFCRVLSIDVLVQGAVLDLSALRLIGKEREKSVSGHINEVGPARSTGVSGITSAKRQCGESQDGAESGGKKRNTAKQRFCLFVPEPPPGVGERSQRREKGRNEIEDPAGATSCGPPPVLQASYDPVGTSMFHGYVSRPTSSSGPRYDRWAACGGCRPPSNRADTETQSVVGNLIAATNTALWLPRACPISPRPPPHRPSGRAPAVLRPRRVRDSAEDEELSEDIRAGESAATSRASCGEVAAVGEEEGGEEAPTESSPGRLPFARSETLFYGQLVSNMH